MVGGRIYMNNTVKKIIVDITVANCQIRAARPKHQHIPMPTLEAEKFLFWNTVDLKRLNERDYGTLRGNALIKARQLVNREGRINISGEYGSIKISESDFIPH
jgi:hypothetical protein